MAKELSYGEMVNLSRQRYQNKLANAKSQVSSYADAIRNDGTDVSDSDEQEMLKQFMRTGEINFSPAQPAAPVVPQRAAAPTAAAPVAAPDAPVLPVANKPATAPEQDDGGFMSTVTKNLFGTTLGQNIEDGIEVVTQASKAAVARVGQGLDRANELSARLGGGFVGAPSYAQTAPTTPESAAARAAAFAESGAKNSQTAGTAEQKAGEIQQSYGDGSIGYHVMGALNSAPSMAVGFGATLAGGPLLGGLAIGGTTAATQYGQQIDEGTSDGKALASAIAQGTIEGGMDVLTMGLAKYGVKPFTEFAVKKLGASAGAALVAKVASTAGGRAAMVAAEGAVNEPITTAAQMASDAVILDKKYTDEDWSRGIRDSFVQGAGISTAAYVAGRPVRAAAERTDLRNTATEGGINAGLAARQNARELAPQTDTSIALPPVEEQRQLFNTPAGLPSPEQYQADRQRELESDAAYNVRNRQQRAEQPVAVRQQRQGEVRQSIQNRVDSARQRVESLQEAIEGGATDSATLNTAAAANRDLQTAESDLTNFEQSIAPTPAQTVEATPAAAPQAEPTQTDMFANEEANRKKAADEEAAAAKKKEADEFEATKKKMEANRRARLAATRKTVAAEVLNENPDMTQADFTAEVNRRTAERDAENAAKTKAKQGRKVTLAPTAPVATAPVVQKADADVSDADLREQLRSAGMDVPDANPALNQDGTPAGVTEDTDDQYVQKAVETIKALSKRGGKSSRDVQNLIGQGKLVLASNPESVGRESPNAVAQFDPQEGKMYLYMDRIGTQNPVAAVAASLHEATHAGQFNDRQGRSSLYVQMMSKNGNNKASNAIRQAAAKGNKMAQRALAQAEAASPNTAIKDLELVPYFVTEAAQSRGTTYGQLGGVVKDIKGAARSFLRDNVGMDLDVTLDDVNTAAQGVGGEIAQTDIVPGQDGPTVDMIAGPNARDFNAAQRYGRTFRGKADNGERFEIPDNGAELVSKDASELQTLLANKDTKLSDLLTHDKLYANYPELADVKVSVDANMGPSTNGMFSKGEIKVAPRLLKTPDALRKLLLHETQHAIQKFEGFVGGANSDIFIPTKPYEDQLAAERSMELISKNFEMATAAASLGPSAKARWNSEIAGGKFNDRAKMIDAFIKGGYAEQSSNATIRSQGTRYMDAADRYNAAAKEILDARGNAFDKYIRDYGEAEARNTEYRSRMSADQLAANPPESTFNRMQYPVEVSETTDNRKRMGMNAPAFNQEATARTPVPEENLSDKEHLTRILSKGTQNHTADIKIAEDYDTRYRRAMKQDLGPRYDKPEVRKDIFEMLGKVDDAAPADRGARWGEFRQKYPTLAPLLANVRAEIDKGTNDYIQKLMSTGRPLSNTEVKNVQTMLANRGKYLTRSYSAFQNGIGRKWRENVWSDYKNNINKYATSPERLAPHVRENVERVTNAMNFLESKLTIPDDDALLGANMDKLNEMYSDHIGPLNRIRADDTEGKRAIMIQALADRRDSIPDEEMKALAENAVKEMLNLTATSTSGVGTRLAKLARDPGTLKEKEFVPEEIRKLFGEIKDPGGVILSTMSAQASLNARMGLYKDLMTDGLGRHALEPARINEEGMREKFPHRLEGEQYGPMEGYYVTERTRDALTDQVKAFYTYGEAIKQFGNDSSILVGKVLKDVGRGLATATRYEKLLGVVYTPFNFAGNALSSPISLMRQGNINPVTAWKGVRTSYDYVKGSIWNTTTDLLNDSIRYVNIESVDVAEMQRVLGNKMMDYLDGTESRLEAQNKFKSALGAIGTGIRKGNKLAVAGYSVMDNWSKVANFYDRANTLKAYYDAAGQSRTKEQILREAGDSTSYTNLSPERVHSFLRGLESNGLTKFLPYFAEVFRTTFTNYNQGLLDLQRASETENPKAASIMRTAGMRRIIGNTLATVGVPSVLAVPALGAMLASGGGEDEKKKRHMIGKFSRDQDLMQFGTDENGMPVYMAVSTRLDPHGPITDLVRMAINAEDDKSLYNSAKNYVWENLILAPQWGKNLVGALTKPTVPESTTAQVFPDIADRLQAAGVDPNNTNKALRVVDSWLPGVLKAQAPYAKPNVDTTVTGVSKEALQGMNWMGARFETLNPQRTLNDYEFASSTAKKDNRSILNDNIANAVKLKDEDVVRWATEYRAKELNRLVEDQKNVASLRAWGFKEEDIATMLKKSGWSASDIAILTSGEGTIPLSMDTLKNALDRRKEGVTDQRLKDQYDARLQEATDIIQAHADEFAQMGLEVK